MDSLYGGHPGVSFVLKGSFKSVSEMADAFGRGAEYKDVWYNEYAIIDTKNKNHKDNGKIYRRGLNFQGENGGAIYVGQIVGPSSGTPYFQVNSIDNVKKKANEELDDYEYRRYPTGKNDDGAFITTDSGSQIGEFDFSQNDYSLVPGKNGDEYNDSIKYTWVNIRNDGVNPDDEDSYSDSWFYVGLQIPYHVTDYKVHTVSPYNDKGVFSDTATVENKSEVADDGSFVHPFYSIWDVGVPRGVKGDAIRNLRVITIDDSFVSEYGESGDKYIYRPSALVVDDKSGAASFAEITAANRSEMTYTPTAEDASLNRQIVAFDFYMFDNIRNPAPFLIYIGDFRTIREVNVSDNGTIRVTYTNGSDTVLDQRIRWINSASLTTGNGSAGGTLSFEYNNNSNGRPGIESFNICFVKNISVADDGTVTYTYCGNPDINMLPEGAKLVGNDGSGVYSVEKKIKWIDNVSLDPTTGKFGMRFNNSTLENQDDFDYSTILDYVRDITIDESNGKIVLYHTTLSNDGDERDSSGNIIPGTKTLAARLKIMTSASVSNDGLMTIGFNTGDTLVVRSADAADGSAHHFREIRDVTIDSGIAADKHIQVRYNDSNVAQKIGDSINYVDDMIVRPTDFHLLIAFSDPSKRPITTRSYNDNGNLETKVDYSKSICTDANGWISNDSVKSFYVNSAYEGADMYWRDFGTIKDQSGILIGFNIEHDTVAKFDGWDTEDKDRTIIGYLNKVYPNGLTEDVNNGQNVKQKIVTYSPSAEQGKQDKEFYAYDYNVGKWYYLGTIADTGTRDVKLFNGTNPTAEDLKNLNSNGLLFKYGLMTYEEEPLPLFWSSAYDGWE